LKEFFPSQTCPGCYFSAPYSGQRNGNSDSLGALLARSELRKGFGNYSALVNERN